jgi:hypothetical protein
VPNWKSAEVTLVSELMPSMKNVVVFAKNGLCGPLPAMLPFAAL